MDGHQHNITNQYTQYNHAQPKQQRHQQQPQQAASLAGPVAPQLSYTPYPSVATAAGSYAAPPVPPPAYSNHPPTPSWQPNWTQHAYQPPQAPLHSYRAYARPSPTAGGIPAGLTGGEDEFEFGSFGQPSWAGHSSQQHNPQRRDSTSSVQYGSYPTNQFSEQYHRRGSVPQDPRGASHELQPQYSPAHPGMYPVPTQPHRTPQFDSLGLGMSPTNVGLPAPAEVSHSYLSRTINHDHYAATPRQPQPQPQPLMMPPPTRPRSAAAPLSIDTRSSLSAEVSQGPYSAAARLSGFPAQGTYSPGPVEGQQHGAVHGGLSSEWRRRGSVYEDLPSSEPLAGGSARSTPSLQSLPSNGSSASLQNANGSRAPSHPAEYSNYHTPSPALGAVSLYDPPYQAGPSTQAGPSSLAPPRPTAQAAKSFSLPPAKAATRRPSSRSIADYIPSEVDPSLPIVRLATEQRRLMSGMPASASKKNRPLLDPLMSPVEGEFAAQHSASPSGSSLPEPKVVEKAGKVTVNMTVACWRCASPLAGLTLRGSRAQFGEAYHAAYFCLQCGPLDEPESDADGTRQDKPANENDEFLSYEYTFSAALDRLQGLTIEPDDPRPKAVRSSRPVPAGARRRQDDALLQCDVCMRTIGSGGMYLSERREVVAFQIEVICVPCSTKYRRCSDCGGGGGPRLGVGKWRCAELFEEGRKNCILSHHRQGADQEQTFDVWAMRDVPSHELDELIEQCRNLFTSAMHAMVANPELLEAHRPMARSFGEVLKITGDWWSAFLPSYREDIEPTKGIRRYIGLRWSAPALRKKAKAKAGGKGVGGEVGEEQGEEEWGRPESVLRKGKVLASYIIAEWDINLGSLFVSLVMPKGTGHTYDANTALMTLLARHAERDALALRHANPAVPLLSEVWTMLVVVKESHFLNRDGGRRGFIPVEDYIAEGGDPRHFPPYREVYLPAEFLKGWRVMARGWGPGAELTAAVAGKARKRKAPKEEDDRGNAMDDRHSGLDGRRTVTC